MADRVMASGNCLLDHKRLNPGSGKFGIQHPRTHAITHSLVFAARAAGRRLQPAHHEGIGQLRAIHHNCELARAHEV